MYTVYWLHFPHQQSTDQGYVGVTSNLSRRLQQHKSNIKRNRPDKVLTKHLTLSDWENIQCDVLMTGDKNQCFARELELRPVPNIGWNERSGGNLTVHSEASKQAMSIKNTGKPSARKGVSNTPEHVNKMVQTRKANDTYKHTEESKEAIRLATEYEKSHAAVAIYFTTDTKETLYKCVRRCADEEAINYSVIRSRLRRNQANMIKGWAVRYAHTE